MHYSIQNDGSTRIGQSVPLHPQYRTLVVQI